MYRESRMRVMKNTMKNLDKLSDYQPTFEEKDRFNKIIKKINNNWKINEGP